MNFSIVLLSIGILSGLSDAYRDLEKECISDKVPENLIELKTDWYSISSRLKRSAESLGGSAKIYSFDKGIFIKPSAMFARNLMIPSDEIAGCTMTCFGTCDQHENLLIPKTGADIRIQRTDEIIDWCWENKKRCTLDIQNDSGCTKTTNFQREKNL